MSRDESEGTAGSRDRLIVESTQDVIVEFDERARVTYISPSFPELSGFPADRILGRCLDDLTPWLIHPDDHAAAHQMLTRVFASDRLASATLRVNLAHGAMVTVEARARRRAEADGSWRGVSLFRDVTEREEAVRALAESEARHRTLVSTLGQLVIWLGARGSIEERMPEWEAYTGQDFEQYRGSGWQDAIHPDDLPRAFDIGRRRYERSEPFALEFRLRNARLEEWRHNRAHVAPLMGEEGEVVGWVTVFADVHEEVLVHRALDQKEEQLRHSLEASGVGVWSWREDGQTVETDARAREVLGVSDEVTDTADFLSCLHPDDRPLLSESFQKARATRQSYEIVYRMLKPGGGVRWVQDSGRPLEDEEGRFLGMTGLLRDVTLQRRAELAREDLLAQLDRRNREMERFTFTVAHDLKSPLVTVKGFLALLKDDLRSGESGRVEEDTREIVRAVDHMRAMLDDLLDLSRSGAVIHPARSVSLGDIVGDAARSVRSELEDHGVELVIPDDLPLVHGDRQRLAAVFQNLLQNAAKFSGDQASPRVEISASVEPDEVVVRVSDDGVGIDERRIADVFDLFTRLDDRAEGTGVGLAIVRRVVEAHGGRCWAESEGRGCGSSFVITLPHDHSPPVEDPR